MIGLFPTLPPDKLKKKLSYIDIKNYSQEKITYVKILYIVFIIIWLILIYIFKLFIADYLGWIIITIPIVIFLFGYINANKLTSDVENEVFQANYLSIGLLVVLPLLTWMNKDYNGDKKQFTSILVFALIITMCSMFDIWIGIQWLSLIKHLRSCLQTMSLTLLIYALYTYYVSKPHNILQ